MKYRSIAAASFLLFLSQTTVNAADLTINISNVENGDGTIRAALWTNAADFLDEDATFAAIAVAAKTGAVRLVFPDLMPGIYAFSLFHDENGNKELDTDLLGIPSERHAFSKNAYRLFGPAKFEDAAFEVTDADIQTDIEMR